MRRRVLFALVALALLGALGAGLARGERAQHGNLIVSLDGRLSPLKLPRDHVMPVTVRLEGGLRTADGGLLPRVTKIELGLPNQGVLETRGLPTCAQGRLRNARRADALAACGDALVGHGQLQAEVLVPHQPPFTIHAHLLAFNGRVGRSRAVILHAVAADPPTVVVLPFIVHQRGGRLGTGLVAHLPPALGPWPHFARFEISLSRRYFYRGRSRGFVSASCPIPPSLSTGFFSFAQATFTLVGGQRVGVGIPRSCKAD